MEDETNKQSKTLWFLVRYNWITKETLFSKLDNELNMEDLSPEETLHKCEVTITFPPKIPGTIAKECYIESDKIDPLKINCRDVLCRINPVRAFPVLSGPTIYSAYLGSFFNPPSAKESMSVSFSGRKFIISVEEVTKK